MHLPGISGNKDGTGVFRGQGALSHLEEILPGYKNILIFNDRDGFHPCGAAAYFKMLAEKFAGRCAFQYVSYSGKALPIEDVEAKYLEIKHRAGVDLITAVGGGSVILPRPGQPRGFALYPDNGGNRQRGHILCGGIQR
jgi:alcohol dehydrogenase YqhD (iron-dependent ADH family)